MFFAALDLQALRSVRIGPFAVLDLTASVLIAYHWGKWPGVAKMFVLAYIVHRLVGADTPMTLMINELLGL